MVYKMHLRKAIYVVPALLLLAACQKAPAPNVAATVNGRPITYDDIDRIYQSQLSTPGERAGVSSDLVEIQKLEILRSLIEREIMVQRAEKLGLLATDSEVDAKFNELKSALHAGGVPEAARSAENDGQRAEDPAAARPDLREAHQQGGRLQDQHHRQGDRRLLRRKQGQF